MTSTRSILGRLDAIVADLEGTTFHNEARAAVRATLATSGERQAVKHAKRIRENYRAMRAHSDSLKAAS